MDCLASALGTRESASIVPVPSVDVSAIDGLLESPGELFGLERHAVDLVVRVGVDQVLRPDERGELTEVHLRNDHLLVPLQDLREVLREGIEVAQVGLRNGAALATDAADGR